MFDDLDLKVSDAKPLAPSISTADGCSGTWCLTQQCRTVATCSGSYTQ